MKINLRKLTQIILEVCKETAIELNDVSQQITLIVNVVSAVFANIGLDIDEPAGSRDLLSQKLADAVIAKLQEEV